MQCRRFFRLRDIYECPQKLFILHLHYFIIVSINTGFKVILSVDVNEYIIRERLVYILRALRLMEVYCTKGALYPT